MKGHRVLLITLILLQPLTCGLTAVQVWSFFNPYPGALPLSQPYYSINVTSRRAQFEYARNLVTKDPLETVRRRLGRNGRPVQPATSPAEYVRNQQANHLNFISIGRSISITPRPDGRIWIGVGVSIGLHLDALHVPQLGT